MEQKQIKRYLVLSQEELKYLVECLSKSPNIDLTHPAIAKTIRLYIKKPRTIKTKKEQLTTSEKKEEPKEVKIKIDDEIKRRLGLI